MMTSNHYDLFVIGAGSGGIRAAREAAEHGAKVGIAESYRVGGTCVIRGCVPKKMMAYAARIGDSFSDAPGFGWRLPETPDLDWPKFRNHMADRVAYLTTLYRKKLEAAGVEIFNAKANFKDNRTINLQGNNRQSDDGDKTITSEIFLIATGATPVLPDQIAGINHAITSNEVFLLKELPGSILVIGGGVHRGGI